MALATGSQPSYNMHNVQRLTKRQRDVAYLISLGYTNSQIAKELHIQLRTVERHVGDTIDKLGIPRSQAVRSLRTAIVVALLCSCKPGKVGCKYHDLVNDTFANFYNHGVYAGKIAVTKESE